MNTYKVEVSSLEACKDVKVSSKVYLKRGTIVRATDEAQKQYGHSRWIEIETINTPTVRGYVQLKYLSII